VADSPATLDAIEQLAPPPPRGRRKQPPVLLAVAGGLVAAAAALPAAYLLLRAWTGGTASVVETLSAPSTLLLLLRTVLLCAAVTATTIAIAVPLAWLTVRSDLPGRRWFVVLTALPLVIPSYVGGYAFVGALGPRGLVQGWLQPLGVDRLPTIYGFGGAWLVLSLFTYPLVLLTVRSSLRGLDPALEEAARSLGDPARRAFRRVTLPQLRPAIASGGLLVALYVLHDFGAVSLLRFDSFTRAIYVAYRGSFDRSVAATLGLVLVALTAVVLAGEARTRGRAAYHSAHAGSARVPTVTRLGRLRWVAFAFCVVLVVFALALPMFVIAYWLVRGLAAGEPLRVAIAPMLGSLQASAAGAVACLVCAWPLAVLAARYPGRLSRALERASFTGYSLPGIVVALALVFFGANYVPFLYQTRFLLVFAYVVLFLPQAVGALHASLVQISPSLEEAARSLGAGPVRTLVRVTLPLVRPGIGTAAALVFLTAMKELPATLLLAPTGFRTLATEVWDATSGAFFSRAAPAALLLVLLSSAPLAVLVLRERKH
jgi:iron(III) transport system permease protein